MDLLRFITGGFVKDGKSTFIGRLPCDSVSFSKNLPDAMEYRKKKARF